MTEWKRSRDARGYAKPTYRDSKTRAIVTGPLDRPADFARVYCACQCPCGCTYAARSFAPDWSERPDLCGACQPPNDEHERPLANAERAILDRSTEPNR